MRNDHAAGTTGGIVAKSLQRAFLLIVFLSVSLILSIIVEWIWIAYMTEDKGLTHSQNMIRAERDFLRMASDRFVYDLEPDEVENIVLSNVEKVVSYTRLESLATSTTNTVYVAVFSAINMTIVFSLRIAVMVLSMPTFIVFGMVGFVRGIVARDIRIWCGGRESSGMYHLYLEIMPVAFIGIWLLYLSSPVTINPFYLIGPGAIVFGFIISRLVYRFKKYI